MQELVYLPVEQVSATHYTAKINIANRVPLLFALIGCASDFVEEFIKSIYDYMQGLDLYMVLPSVFACVAVAIIVTVWLRLENSKTNMLRILFAVPQQKVIAHVKRNEDLILGVEGNNNALTELIAERSKEKQTNIKLKRILRGVV